MIEHGISTKPFHGDCGVSSAPEEERVYRKNLVEIALKLYHLGIYNWSEVFGMKDEDILRIRSVGMGKLGVVREFQRKIKGYRENAQPAEWQIARSSLHAKPKGLKVGGMFVPLILPYEWDGFYRSLQEQDKTRDPNFTVELEEKVLPAMQGNIRFLNEELNLGIETEDPIRIGNKVALKCSFVKRNGVMDQSHIRL